MINIDWLLAEGKTFVNFVYILKNASSDKIYQTELLDTLLQEFWEANFDKIFYRVLVPWACYSLGCLYFYMVILQDGYDESDYEWDAVYKWVLSGTIIIFLSYQIYIEVIQSVGISGISVKDYFGNLSNYIDLYTYGVSAWLIAVQLT